VNVCKASDESDWAEWLRRITCGDASAEAELYHRYKDGVAVIIGQIVHNASVAEDLSQETFRISLEKIRGRAVREPERLSGFVRGVARNLAIDYTRKMRRALNQEDAIDAEQIRDPQPDPYDHLLRKERAGLVRQIISEMKGERGREVLSRYFIAEESKDQICADLGLTSRHFNSIVHRALKRYKELYIKRFGNPWSDDPQNIFD
jgi:RNA polymerase sigma-70 factor (ECF subfamily)